MRKAAIYYKSLYAGELAENEEGYSFCYDADYIQHPDARAISLTMPLKGAAYRSNTMFPFFDGLIPEGWLLDVATDNWKIDPRDRMGLLMACCADCIGAVSVKPIEEDKP